MILKKPWLRNKLLLKVVENYPSFIIIYDAEGKITHLNKAAVHATGKSPTELLGRKDEELFPQAVTAQYLPTLKQVQETKKLATAELILKQDGEIRVKELSYVPLLDEGNNLISILAYGYDITRLKNTETELKAEQRRLRTEQNIFKSLMQNVQEGIVVAEKPFRIMAVSQYAVDTSGLFWEDYCTNSFEEFSRKFKLLKLDTSPVPQEEHPLTKALATGEATINKQFTLRDKQGELRTCISSTTAIKDEKGEITGAIISWRDITDIKGLEALYKSLFDHSSDGILLFDMESRTYVDCNLSWEKISGYTKEEVIKQEFGFFTPEELKPRLAELSHNMLTGGGQKQEWQIKKSTGNIIPIEITGNIIQVEGKIFFQSIIRDITERIEYEGKLKESEERYRTFFESSSDGIIFHDVKGQILEVNTAYCRMLGYTENELIGMPFQNTVSPHRQTASKEFMEKVIATGEAGIFENELQRKDGSALAVEVKSWVKKSEEGVVTGLWKINRDITQRKRAEEALRRSELRYRTLFDGSNDAIFILHLDELKYIDSNPKFAELTGYTKEEVIGKKAASLVSPVYMGRGLEEIITELREKRALIYDWELQTKTEECIPVQISARIVEIEGVFYKYSLVRDMRIVKQAQEVLKRDKEELEKLVAERTTALAQAKRMSDLGTALAIITHELRNPLTAIDLALYNIKKKTGEMDTIGRHLEVIEKKVRESNRIIEDVLAFTRINPPKLQEVDLGELLSECEHTAVTRHPETAILLNDRRETGPDFTLKADPVQLSEVLNNILNNAYDALQFPGAKREQGIIEVRAREQDDRVIISIKDNGPGIPPDVKARLFEPFYTTKSKGTGLGLAISKKIMENHGGDIAIESERERGTTVVLSLPKR